jgi:S-disulfanyl-L-cysteine oxidoreductase SoxD
MAGAAAPRTFGFGLLAKPADAVLDQRSLPLVQMPNRGGMTTALGFVRRDGTPDTRNVACMKNCASEIHVTSEMPDYARDQHGNVALQSRALGAAPAPTAARSGGELARVSACPDCHGVTERVVGPAFQEIAEKCAGDGVGEPRLVAKVKARGSGNWGVLSVPAHSQLQDADVRALVQWILGGAQ